MVIAALARAGLGRQRADAREGDGRVSGRARRAAHADGAHDLAVHDDRLTARERRGPGVEQRRASADDGVLEDLGGLLEQGRGPGLLGGDGSPHREGRLQSLEVHEVAALVHDGDRRALMAFHGFGGRGRGGDLGTFQRQAGSALDDLCLAAGGQRQDGNDQDVRFGSHGQ
jgi:hypothetical protein